MPKSDEAQGPAYNVPLTPEELSLVGAFAVVWN